MQISICFLCRIGRKCYVHHKWDNARKQCIRKFAYLKNHIDMDINLQTSYLNVSKFDFSPACSEGHFGIGCVAKCAYPNYGPLCTRICNCTREDCHPRSGCNRSLLVWSYFVILKHIMRQHTHIYRLVYYFIFFFYFKSFIFYDQ